MQGEDHVFLCQRLNDDSILLERRINPGDYVMPISTSTMTNPGGIFNATVQKLENGVAYCEFTLSNFDSSTRRQRRDISSLSQSTGYRPLIAIGNLDSSSKFTQYHQQQYFLFMYKQIH